MDPRHSAYTRRLEKSSHREKALGALAILGVAIGVAGVLSPPLDIGWPSLGGETSDTVVATSTATAAMVPTAAPVAGQQGAARRVYPYSIIPGGVADKEELARIIRNDRTVATHYADFDVANARAVVVTAPRAVYVSYRKGEQVFWTKKKLMLAPGETLLTDGKNEMRARCANRISDVPMFPVESHGPTESELDSFVTEATVEGSSMAVAAGPVDGFGEAGGGSYQTSSFPNGAGLVPPAAQTRLSARGPGSPAGPGSYRPGVSNGGTLRGTEAPRAGAETGTTPPTTGTTTTPPASTPVSTDPTATVPATTEPTPTPGGEGSTGQPTTPTTPTPTPGGDGSTGQPTAPTPTPGGDGGSGQPITPTPTPPVSGTDPAGPELPPSNPELPPTNPELPGTPDNPGNPGNPDTPVTIPGDPTEVPEPGTLWLGGAAFAAMLWMRRKGPRAKG